MATAVSTGKISTRLWLVWLVLIGLVAAIAVVEYDGNEAEKPAPGTIMVDDRALLPELVERIGAIEVAYAGTVHRFGRDSASAWFYHGVHSSSGSVHGHVADPVQAERIAKAFQIFARTRMERRFELNTKADEYGVVTPQIFIMVYRPNELQPLVRFAVGSVAPDGVSRYVLVVGTPLVVTIANYQIDLLLKLIDELKGGAR